MIRSRYPTEKIIVAGDNDCKTEGNPGKAAAEGAAKAIGGIAAFPPGGDFNDLHQAQGLDAVKATIDAALTDPAPQWEKPTFSVCPPRLTGFTL